MTRFGAATHAGLCRENNEDAMAFDADWDVGLVADDLGGLDSGEVASRTVIDCVLDAVRAGHWCTDGVLAAHQQILRATPVLESAGTWRDRVGSAGTGVQLRAERAHWARMAGIAQELVELTLEQTPAGDNVTALCILVNGP
jgi:PPM family protein phosphatase